jgi:hypothetical protein
VSNACGTVALIHAFAAHAAAVGTGTGEIQDGWLGNFVSRTADLDSVGRAAALEDDEALAVSHNDMARQVILHRWFNGIRLISSMRTDVRRGCADALGGAAGLREVRFSRVRSTEASRFIGGWTRIHLAPLERTSIAALRRSLLRTLSENADV